MTPTEIIARAITRERSRAGLSLSALAARAGLAKSTLSQLESGRGNPSVETLWAIAAALDVPFSYLFETAVPGPVLIRNDAGTPIKATDAGFSAVLLADCPPAARRELYRADLTLGAPRVAAAHQPGTVEHAVVISGRARIGPAGATEDLDPGDYYRYPADQAHHYEALTETAGLALMMEHPR
ncbi:helix-turn-helix domain-containing protein [Tropicimonas sp. IMCC34043]|uniref:helix-turn-helix domain-containing protein n=1 Tax=Tropicimonas sp. IMCC34043 TaxID=2248760 RepID=UPI000E250511|nr:XRE family transcriptional regulator [Tropicimonas sp. IMCC34043]